MSIAMTAVVPAEVERVGSSGGPILVSEVASQSSSTSTQHLVHGGSSVEGQTSLGIL